MPELGGVGPVDRRMLGLRRRNRKQALVLEKKAADDTQGSSGLRRRKRKQALGFREEGSRRNASERVGAAVVAVVADVVAGVGADYEDPHSYVHSCTAALYLREQCLRTRVRQVGRREEERQRLLQQARRRLQRGSQSRVVTARCY